MRQSSPSSSRAGVPSPGCAGFTLLEVLAAVAVLGVLYTVLAGSAIQGVRAEGESRRLLEASLVADEELTELEAGMASGVTPPVGVTETELDEFQITLDVQPFEIPLPLRDDEEAEDAEASLVGSSEEGNPISLLTGAEDASPVRVIHLRVSWTEAGAERSVVRTTYAFDLGAVAGLLGPLDDGAGDTGVPSLQDLLDPDAPGIPRRQGRPLEDLNR